MPVFLTQFIVANWKKIATLVFFLAACLGSYTYGRYGSKSQVNEKITETSTESEKTNEKASESTNKEKVVVIIKHPDGTEETRIEEREVTNKVNESAKAKEKSQATATEKTPVSKKYRAGALIQANPYDLYGDHKAVSYSATISRRVWGQFWVDGLYNFGKKEIGVGVSLEF